MGAISLSILLPRLRLFRTRAIITECSAFSSFVTTDFDLSNPEAESRDKCVPTSPAALAQLSTQMRTILGASATEVVAFKARCGFTPLYTYSLDAKNNTQLQAISLYQNPTLIAALSISLVLAAVLAGKHFSDIHFLFP
jgi:hypothetical protein